MSESLFPTFHKISQTPLRDMLRFRLTGRLDWKNRLATAGLPMAAVNLITRVVKRTRLWRLEQAAVADELTSHFRDGLAAGSSVDDLIGRFGDPRTAAKLIRRSKRRNRPVVWHVFNYAFRAMLILLFIWALIFIRFCIGGPKPSVDYIAQLNAPILSTPKSDRAWPIWRKAILAASDGPGKDSPVSFEGALGGDCDKIPWSQTANWLDHHQSSLELARVAAQKPVMGFVLGTGGSTEDAELFRMSSDRAKGVDQPLMTVLLPHLSMARTMALILSLDARRAVELKDGDRAVADMLAVFGLARQLREPHDLLMNQLVALAIDSLGVERLQQTIRTHPDVLSNKQMIEFAHLLYGPRVAADLISLKGERIFFADVVQRVYTDDGHGDGHITFKGMQNVPNFITIGGHNQLTIDFMGFALSAPMLISSRAEMAGLYDRFMNQTDANFQQPLRQVNWDSLDSQLISLRASPVQSMRYILVSTLLPSLARSQANCEQYLGERDGTLVAISLELFHRRHGVYPASLVDLVPELLPEIPVDRITGDPVKYRLIDGKPVVYSVGADRIDDGGIPPARKGGYRWQSAADRWDVKPAKAPRGDWVLYPTDPGVDEN